MVAERAPAEVPRAVAIVMDGNGRWASANGVSVAEGHRAGSRALRPIVETAIDLGIESLAVYAFSTENWTRSEDEVGALMEIFGETIDRELVDLAKEGVRTRFVGRRDRAPGWLRAIIGGPAPGVESVIGQQPGPQPTRTPTTPAPNPQPTPSSVPDRQMRLQRARTLMQQYRELPAEDMEAALKEAGYDEEEIREILGTPQR